MGNAGLYENYWKNGDGDSVFLQIEARGTFEIYQTRTSVSRSPMLNMVPRPMISLLVPDGRMQGTRPCVMTYMDGREG